MADNITNISGVKTNELPAADAVTDQHLFIVADKTTGFAYKATERQVKDAIAVNADFNTAILTTVPTGAADGTVYFPIQVGSYPNFLNQSGVALAFASTDGIAYFIYNGTYWTKINSTTDLTNYTTDAEFAPVKTDVDILSDIIFTISGGDFILVDGNGYIGLRLTTQGILKVSEVNANKYKVEDIVELTRNPQFALAIADSNKNLAFAVRNDGTVVSKIIQVEDLTVTFPDGTSIGGFNGKYFIYGAPTEMMLIMSYGQSNSVGAGSSADPVTTTQIYDSLMFVGGARPEPSNANSFASLVPLIEGGAGYSESPMSGCVETIIDNVEKVNFTPFANKGWQFLCGAPGVGGQTIQQLSKGDATGYYLRALSYTDYALKRAAESTKKLSIPFMLWTQGGSDIPATTKADYHTRLNQLIIDYNTDLVPMTKQHNNLMWIGAQEAVHADLDQDGIAQAQYDVMLENPSYTIACPIYVMKFEFDNAHYKPESDRILGAYYGIYAHRWLTGNTKPFPLYPVQFTVSGNSIVIRFHVPSPPLKFDATFIAQAANQGFRVLDGTGSTIAITSVNITSTDTVTITVASNPSAGRILYARPANYVWTNFGSYQMVNSCGNLRDSQGDKIIRYGTPMHNYCLAFNIVLPIGEVKAKAFFSFPARNSTGAVYTTTVDDPKLGTITLATYTQQAGDTTDTTFNTNFIASLNTNTYGYTVELYLTTGFYIIAPKGYGATINGKKATIARPPSSQLADFLGGVTSTN